MRRTFLFLLLASLSLVPNDLAASDRVHVYTVVFDAPPVAKMLAAPLSPRNRKGQDLRKMASDVETRRAALVRRIEAEDVEIIASVENVLNAVFIRTTKDRADSVGAMQGVRRVTRSRRFEPLVNRAGDVIRAPEARAVLGGDDFAGDGYRIAVIDSGIDVTHPAFRADGFQYSSGFPKGRPEDLDFANEKVIAARSYVHLLSPEDPASSRPDDMTPADRIGHGTSVAMIAAGRTVDSPAGRLTGVAPGAYVGNYKIFGSPDINEFANDAAVIAAIDDAVIDGFDILSVSFGAVAQYPFDEVCADDQGEFFCDPVAQAAQNAILDFGVVIAAAAGNAGAFGVQSQPTQNTIATPATAPSVITVGATLNSRQIVQTVRFGGQEALAIMGTGPEPGSTLTARAVDAASAGDAQLCGPVNPGSFSGAIAVIERGACEPEFKVEFADEAGAVGVVLVNTGIDAPEIVTGLESTDIPTFTIGSGDGQRLISYIGGTGNPTVSLDPAVRENSGFATDQIAPFSSRGPTPGGAIKPEIVAPGTFIFSGAQTLDSNGDAFSETRFEAVDGTSFAAPFVAGAAALVWQANPSFTADDVKSALVNTASTNVVENGADAPVTSAGAGRLDVRSALGPIATLFPATISFGRVNDEPLPIERTLEITNTTDFPATFQVAVIPKDFSEDARVRVNGVDTTSVRLNPGEIGTVNVTLTGRTPLAGQYEGVLQVSRDVGGLELLAPYYFAVGDNIPADAFALTGVGVVGTVNEPHPELLILKVLDQHGQAVSGADVTFEVTAGGGAIFQADPATDLFGVAAADVDMGPDTGFQDYLARVGNIEVAFFNEARNKPAVGAVVNGAGFAANLPVAPGSIASVFGSSLSEFTGSATRLPLNIALKHVSVSFDFPEDDLSIPGRLFFASDGQLNVQIPWELAGRNFVIMKTRIEDSVSETVTVNLADTSPGLFEFSLDGRQVLVATHADGSVITPQNPARPGETIVVYGTGFGPVDREQQSGVAAEGLARVLAPVAASIGGLQAGISFAGLTPGFVGLYQANVTLPSNLPSGEHRLTFAANGINSNSALVFVQ